MVTIADGLSRVYRGVPIGCEDGKSGTDVADCMGQRSLCPMDFKGEKGNIMRNLRWLLAAVVPVVGMSLVASPASAIVIDDFTSPSAYSNTYSPSDSPVNQVDNGTMFGGIRTINLTFNGTSDITDTVTLALDPAAVSSPSNGIFDVNSASGVSDLVLDLTYDTSTLGPGIADSIDLTVHNVASGDTVDIQLLVNGVPFGAIQSVSGGGAFPQTLSFLLGIDTSTINTIGFVFSGAGGTGVDFTLTHIELNVSEEEVPEPASLAVWGVMGLTGMVAARRRRRKA